MVDSYLSCLGCELLTCLVIYPVKTDLGLADFVICVPIKVKFAVRSSGNWVLFRAENGDIIDAQLNSS